MSKKVFIKTLGCQMNVRDSEIILGLLQKKGFTRAKSLDEADVILFNTCSVRQHAEERVWGKVGMLKKFVSFPKFAGANLNRLGIRSHKKTVVPLSFAKAKLGRGGDYPDKKIIGVIGCMAQNYKNEIFRRLPHVDFVCGPANIYEIPSLIEKAIQEDVQTLAIDKEQRPLRKEGSRDSTLKAFVSIMYGCNNFCSYCIVPYVRGRERSRPLKHILDEVENLAQRGCKEITLLGQNVNSYGNDLQEKINFIRLLEKLNRVDGVERIRFVTSHPKDASLDLFKAMRDLPKVCEHLHLPLQAGSDKILRLMNRRYTLTDYLELIDCLRQQIPDCSITTDIIVGFPGESETDFERTYQAMEKIQFDEAFIFKYSPRPKTKAAQLQDDVAMETKQKRNQRLLKLQEAISLKRNRNLLGSSVEVLTETVGNYFESGVKKKALQGRSRTNKVTLFSGENKFISQLVKVKINKVTTHTLIGEFNGKFC
jgi:tRNA-2-methylthio-N6-dimethylallyladenosine synthase